MAYHTNLLFFPLNLLYFLREFDYQRWGGEGDRHLFGINFMFLYDFGHHIKSWRWIYWVFCTKKRILPLVVFQFIFGAYVLL